MGVRYGKRVEKLQGHPDRSVRVGFGGGVRGVWVYTRRVRVATRSLHPRGSPSPRDVWVSVKDRGLDL